MADRPNILLIFTDQQRGDTIHAGGNPVIRTPNLDRLAAEGTRFSSAYTAAPVCVPARCSLITGQYPHNTGCSDNSHPMPDDRPSFMELLTESGYRTHGIGKCHFTPDLFALRGFQTREVQEELTASPERDDYLVWLREQGVTHLHDPHGVRGEMYYIPQPAQVSPDLHPTNWVGDRSVEWLRTQPKSEPFFLFSSFIHPHPPFAPPTPWHKLYRAPLMPLPKRPDSSEALHTYVNKFQNRYKFRDAGVDNNLMRNIKAYYYACISFIDYQIGRILAALEETNRLDDTLILFHSDHGEFLGDYYCFGKRSMMDATARVPLLARYPDRFDAGEVCDAPVSGVDVMPTVLNAAGVSWSGLPLDGLDLAESASGARSEERTVYSQYQRDERAVYMALNRRWKYFYSVPDRREFLFDRVSDPDERRNQAGLVFRRGVVAEMRGGLIDYFRSQGYTRPIYGNRWRDYPQPSVPVDPDAGLLIQDPKWSVPLQHIPGYSDEE